MNYAEHFFAALCSLNEFVYPRAVIRYQREIIEHGSFSLPSPWTGKSLYPTACHVSNLGDPAHGNLGIAYRLECDSPLWLLANSVKDGFPITEAYAPLLDESLWCRSDAHKAENEPWKRVLFDLERLGGCTRQALNDNGGPVVLMGHPNFAHHVWNELSALHRYCQSRSVGTAAMEFRVLYEPLVPLTAIAGDTPVRVSQPHSFKSAMGFQQSLVTRLGSTQISVAVREKLASLLNKRRDRPVTDAWADVLLGSGPVVWLSARLDARTLDNQTEFLSCLIARIVEHYPHAAFVVDGFSYANDFGSPVYLQEGAGDAICSGRGTQQACSFLGSAMKTREQQVTAYIADLRDNLGTRLANTILNVSGMNLADAIYCAGLAQYYVCHAGTLQHKIAWMHNTPGTVHSNTAGVARGVSKWLADQLEDGLAPSLISAENVLDLDSIRTSSQVDRNRDYHLLNVESVVAGILQDMHRNIAS